MRTLRLLTWSKLHRLQVADLEFEHSGLASESNFCVWHCSARPLITKQPRILTGNVSNSEAEKKQKCWAVSAENDLPSPRPFIAHPGSESVGLQYCQLSYVFLNGNRGAHSYLCFINVSLERALRYPGGLSVLFKDLVIPIFLSTLG